VKPVTAFGWVTFAFGAFAAVMVLVTLGQQTQKEAVIRFVACAVLALAGVVIARRARPRAAQIDPVQAEREILRTASAHNGRVTATGVAAQTAVPLAQASDMLEALSRRGLCRMSVAEAGILVFEFPELEQAEGQGDGASNRAAHASRAGSQRSTS
jgi:hypothetical protein